MKIYSETKTPNTKCSININYNTLLYSQLLHLPSKSDSICWRMQTNLLPSKISIPGGGSIFGFTDFLLGRILILRSPPRPRVIRRFFISSNTSLVVRESVDMLDTTECLGWVYITELLATLSCTRDCLLTSFRCTSSGTIIFVRYSVNPYIPKLKTYLWREKSKIRSNNVKIVYHLKRAIQTCHF